MINSKLANGSTAIGHAQNIHGNTYVAAKVDDGKYATWALNPHDGETFWGHYFESHDEAIGDMVKRAGYGVA